MRRNKAMLPWHGLPLYAHLARILRGACSEVFLVGNEVPADWTGKTLSDAIAGAGPLGGILSALECAGDPWRLILACDMPLVESGLLDALVARRADGVDAVIPVTPDGRLQPLCGLYHVRAALPLKALLAAATLETDVGRMPSVHHFLAAIRVAEVQVDAALAFANANSMRDYLALMGNHAPPSEGGRSRLHPHSARKNLKQ